MGRFTGVIAALCLCILPAEGRQVEHHSNKETRQEFAVPTMVSKGLEVTDNTFSVHYEIRNDSEKDIWLLAGIGKFDVCADAFVQEDTRTLVLRSRLDAPRRAFGNAIYGRYVRLRAGQTQAESVCFPLPIRLMAGDVPAQEGQEPFYADRLVIEIGYYEGDLYATIQAILRKAEKSASADYDLDLINRWFGGLLGFNELNEGLRARNEEIIIPETGQTLKGEQILQMSCDGLRIACVEEDSVQRHPPDLSGCERIEIRYEPSMLEYFFPWADQRGLMSPEEIEYLHTGKMILVNDVSTLKSLSHDVSKGQYWEGIVRQRHTAYMACYRDGKRLISFPIYNDESIITEAGQSFIYFEGFPSLKMLTPRIQPLELRVQCAANLRDLWHRLRLYRRADSARRPGSFPAQEIRYPPAAKWSDAMFTAYQKTEMADRCILGPYKCPSAAHGKCHYAMNPKCKPGSPQDTVLLFETKAGWNQHGGPELFACDNHDPRGGLVLLNDGTVKFLRTEEELRRLRWE